MSIKRLLYDLATDKVSGPAASAAQFLLWLLSGIYAAGVWLAMASRRGVRLPCRVISVGNVTVGGTGKTVLVEYLARYLGQQGKKMAVLTRGYAPSAGRCPAGCCQGSAADEPRMMQQHLIGIPVLVDPDRIRSAHKAASEFQADTVILDDGLQQWHIRKDLEIVTIDATNPFGNGFLLPRGILRQPLRTLKAADIFVITHADQSCASLEDLKRRLYALNPRAVCCEAIHAPRGWYELADPDRRWDTASVRKEAVGVFCGIGNPESFCRSVEAQGVAVNLFVPFADHHCFSEADLRRLAQQAQRAAVTALITTEKDAVRIPRQALKDFPCRILVMPVGLEIVRNAKEFHDRLLGHASV